MTQHGTKIASSNLDGTIKVWNVESHMFVQEWTHKWGSMIAISPDD